VKEAENLIKNGKFCELRKKEGDNNGSLYNKVRLDFKVLSKFTNDKF